MKMFAVMALSCLVVAGPAAGAGDPLSDARALYAGAAYEEALQALNLVVKTPDTAEQVDQYRAFCLVALGRNADARAVVEALVAEHPLMRLMDDASPRLVAVFTAARRQILPKLIRDTFRAAEGLVDRKDYPAAELRLNTVKQLLDTSDSLGLSDAGIDEIRVLANGFLNLIHVAADAAAPPPPAFSPAAPAAPRTAAAPAVPRATATAEPAATIYTSDSSDVTAPVALSQPIPPLPSELARRMASRQTGRIEVLIDEKGRVESVVIRKSINPFYDTLLKTRAAHWTYRPAQAGTTPVKFRKVIDVVVDPQ